MFAKRFKYWTWQKRQGKFIPEEYTEEDLQSEFFLCMQDYRTNIEMRLGLNLVAEAYNRKSIPVISCGYAKVIDKIREPYNRKPYDNDLIILNSTT